MLNYCADFSIHFKNRRSHPIRAPTIPASLLNRLSWLNKGTLLFSYYPANRAFLALAPFWRTRERLYMNRVRTSLSMRGMLPGYSFEPRPNSHVLLQRYDHKFINKQEGRIYIVDYNILEDIPNYGHKAEGTKRRYACASLGLFYVKQRKNLVPIAIQLHQQPSVDNPIWTPNDTNLDWLCAKMWLRNSDAQFHQVTYLLDSQNFRRVRPYVL